MLKSLRWQFLSPTSPTGKGNVCEENFLLFFRRGVFVSRFGVGLKQDAVTTRLLGGLKLLDSMIPGFVLCLERVGFETT